MLIAFTKISRGCRLTVKRNGGQDNWQNLAQQSINAGAWFVYRLESSAMIV